MLVLVVGDFHLKGKAPICRIDDFVETQFLKLEEIVSIANENDVPIVSVGDIFDSSVVANSIVNRAGEILNSLHNPLYFVWGNHDSLYHSLDLYKRTSLGVLLTNHPKVKHISEFKDDYNFSWDYMDWGEEIVKTKSKLLLTHKAIISNKQAQANFWIANDETFAQRLGNWSKEYEIIICGHWHKSYSFKKDKTIVLNTGAVTRLTIEDNFHPSVCLLNLGTGLFQRHYLETAKPFDDVVSAKHIRNKENNSENIHKFIETIRSKGSKHDSAFMDNLMSLIDNHELDKEMESLLIDILAKTKERNNK